MLRLNSDGKTDSCGLRIPLSKDLDLLCAEVQRTDPRILSLTIADVKGELLAHSYGSDYQQKYLESASGIREKAGLFAALMMGLEQQQEQVFGRTQAVVRLHENANLIVIPFPSKTRILTLLTRNDASGVDLLAKIRLLLRDL